MPSQEVILEDDWVFYRSFTLKDYHASVAFVPYNPCLPHMLDTCEQVSCDEPVVPAEDTVVNPHQICGYSACYLRGEIVYYPASSRNEMEGVDLAGTQTTKAIDPKKKTPFYYRQI